jgi:hypothetical protein
MAGQSEVRIVWDAGRAGAGLKPNQFVRERSANLVPLALCQAFDLTSQFGT